MTGNETSHPSRRLRPRTTTTLPRPTAVSPCCCPLVLLLAATAAIRPADGFSSTRLLSSNGRIRRDKTSREAQTQLLQMERDVSSWWLRPPSQYNDHVVAERRRTSLHAVAIPVANDDSWWHGRDGDDRERMESPIRTIGGGRRKEQQPSDSPQPERTHKKSGQRANTVASARRSRHNDDGSSSSSRSRRNRSGGRNDNDDPRRNIRRMFRKARDLERSGQWKEATTILQKILAVDPHDAHSYLALARLEARREGSGPQVDSRRSPAREAFRAGTEQCPDSVHLWQAWAVHEQSRGDEDRARELFGKALEIDAKNPYVCHAFGLMEQRAGNVDEAQALWERALEGHSTAALVCSLGELYTTSGKFKGAITLYDTHVNRVHSEREIAEIYLAASWLEERHFGDMDRAADLLNMALKRSPGNSRAQVALARLSGRRANQTGKNVAAVRKSLEEACTKHAIGEKSSVRDGRLFNAWAKLEVKAGNLSKARDILRQGIRDFPRDKSLLQAAGKVEERLGNYAGAREMYSSSLSVEPSAVTLVAYALLELHHPSEGKPADIGKVRKLFEEALLVDPRHGPAYNAYGNMEFQRGDIERARDVFQRGVSAHCTDAASVYHGLGKLELSLGNTVTARDILRKGLKEVEKHEAMMENNQLKRAVFLAHTLGMLELNSNRVEEARAIFTKGLSRHPNSSQLLLGAAMGEVKLGNEDDARRYFERAVNIDCKHAQAWQAWAVMEMRAGDYNVAKTLLECGIKEVPTHGALWQAYATMESRRSNVDVARALFAAGIKKCPNHVSLYQGWACLELRGMNFNRAKILITEALTRDKKQGLGWLVSARIEEKQGNDGLAAMVLRRGLECAPKDASLYCALGKIELRRGHIEEARKVFEEGLNFNPLHAPLYHSLAELEAMVFNLDALAKLNKRAAKIFNAEGLTSSSPALAQAWSAKIKRAGSNMKLPEGVAALAAKVGLEEEDVADLEASLSEVDPASMIADIASHKPVHSSDKLLQSVAVQEAAAVSSSSVTKNSQTKTVVLEITDEQ